MDGPTDPYKAVQMLATPPPDLEAPATQLDAAMTVDFKSETNDAVMEDLPESTPQDPHPVPPPADAIINQLRDLVSSRYLNLDPATVQIRAAALFARLKALNRTANAATRACKQATADARLEMDQTHLGLQNLLYEKRHLEREIDKCRQFGSIYQDIPFHSIEEFQQLAPEAARTDDVMLNEHQLMLNRLSFELAERQRLDLRKKELVQQKEELLKHSKIKHTTMDSVKVQIDTLMKTAAEIQKKVDEMVQTIPPARSTPAPS